MEWIGVQRTSRASSCERMQCNAMSCCVIQRTSRASRCAIESGSSPAHRRRSVCDATATPSDRCPPDLLPGRFAPLCKRARVESARSMPRTLLFFFLVSFPQARTGRRLPAFTDDPPRFPRRRALARLFLWAPPLGGGSPLRDRAGRLSSSPPTTTRTRAPRPPLCRRWARRPSGAPRRPARSEVGGSSSNGVCRVRIGCLNHNE